MVLKLKAAQSTIFLDVEWPLLCHRLLDVEDSVDDTVCVVNINMGKQRRSICITSAYYEAQRKGEGV